MTDVAKLQLIEAYHHGILTDIEQKEFDQLMLTDKEFAAELEDYDFLLDGFDMLALEDFETNIQSWEQKHTIQVAELADTKIVSIGNGTNKARKFNFQRFIAVAAAIVGIAFLPLAYSLFFSSTDAYNELFSPPAPIGIVRGGENLEAKENAKNFALGFYLKKDYPRAIELLNTYIDEYGDKEYEAIFFLGVSQMTTENFKAASMSFEHVLEGDKGYFAQGAEWMLALTQYKLGNKVNAIRYAEKIVADPNHNYYNAAKEFLTLVK